MVPAQPVTISLPPYYRIDDFFAFHLRDPQNIAEIVEKNTLRKGIIWQGHAAQIRLSIDDKQATLQLDVDSAETPPPPNERHHLAIHLLGLNQPIEQFEEQYLTHPILGKLIAPQRGVRVYQSATTFEALVWAIIGQQISVLAAIAIRRRFIQAVGQQHSSGIWCFPTAESVMNVDDEMLRQSGFSLGKIIALRGLCDAIQAGKLDLESAVTPDNVNDVTAQLLAIKGIGPWTVSYGLLRGFNYLDGSLHGDVAVRRNLQTLLTQDTQPSAKETQEWLTQFTPWRALVAAHLWRSQSAAGY
ncbi:DNA-3-methyladenine glycosylase family protein [Providencia alcalifaciens]|uniref:DNA-3-methyladenine glycosylase family protein n=1 Tax=Providencia alcalifaciens TaxID=126385 RepID=UPI001CC7DFD9|nr:3-methyladenine DNA glycosylase 2 [Providencia alcalifaciens]CAG9407115.1 DNA-3-methyladenine glycosylase [Providencia alcalifaciens]CAG9407134.1 DNA-3-methyladenine glycosylase [Providencia alcalifaciens]CAG9407304.1 DNA-3-methyladenine glycosylase [Providencia alcalifaciens]CAG9408294.1 DNA-3-methyladenine glycosylase [Providencia alcalifaciens]CAG9408387.1 DNA-3-methyladenine glycosylase [Providencia alcalifaciens]